MEACKGFLGPDRDWPSSAKAEGSLTARPTRRAGTKVGLSDPTVPSGRAVAQRIKADLPQEFTSTGRRCGRHLALRRWWGGALLPRRDSNRRFLSGGCGIFVWASAGNEGPGGMTVANVFPWITTVGAGCMDRTFQADVLLGNGRTIPGVSLYAGGGLPVGRLPPSSTPGTSRSPTTGATDTRPLSVLKDR
ncbi:Subtilisin-like protease SBT1-5 [Nymphaea thermarum]|nr:Subtilisin-like protease SBT1-5 [Nymphaea thermarum]